MPRFCVHGLTIESDLPLLSQVACDTGAHGETVDVSAGPVPDGLVKPEISRRFYEAAPGEVLMRTRGVGRMRIRAGTQIRYELASPDNAADLAAHILGTGCAVIHQQRGNVVLHGASICRDGRVFLICGPSGAGKSTIAAHILENGGTTLGDDVCAIGEAPRFLVFPGPPSTKLAEDSLAGLPDYRSRPQVGTCPSGKAIIATADRFENAPRPLAGIVMLAPTASDGAVGLQCLPAAQALAGLRENTFRKRCITSDVAPALFARWSEIAHAIPAWRITRPVASDTRAEIVTMVEQLLTGAGSRHDAIGESRLQTQGIE